VEGDLSAADTGAVQAHLDHCPSCRAAAESLRTSQAWLRDALAPPFGAADEGAWQRAVMTQIHAEAAAKPVRRLAVRRGLLAACAASLLMAILVWRRESKDPAQLPGIEVPSALKPVATQPEALPIHPPPEAPRLAQRPPRTALTQNAGSPPPVEPARIEFQTADPTIRIIWLARATPLPEANPSTQEAP
jgi:anti-sigma factor RsiW